LTDRTTRAFRNLPIRHKLMVIVMLTTTSALLLAGMGIIVSDSFLLREFLQRDLSALAGIIADNSTASLAFDDPQSAAETLGTFRTKSHIVAACIYRADGRLLARYLRADAVSGCPPDSAGNEIRSTHNDMAVTRIILLGNRRLGTLALLYDLGEINERMRLYAGVVLAILLGSTLIAVLLSSWLRATIATPISQLADAAALVSDTRDYSIRAEKISTDELGVLVDAFNEMLARIQLRDDRLKKALTAREEALREAQSARDSLKITLASIGDAVISTDVEGRIVFANRVAQSLLKYGEAELIGTHLDEVFRTVNELDRAKCESPVARILRHDTIAAASNQTVLIARDGTETPIENSGAPIGSENGDIQGAVLVFRDVTSRRRAEETLGLLASIVESSDDAIIGSDLDGMVTTWNKGAERTFGYSLDEVIGRPISVISGPGLPDEMPEILERIRAGEKIDPYATVRRARSGVSIAVSVAVSALRDGLGRVAGASLIARDIGEQVRAAERLARLNRDLRTTNENLARSNEDLERFAFVASHDLQEPLRMITVYSQLLVKMYSQEADSQASDFLANIVGGTRRMRALLSDLLAFTEIGARREEAAEAVDLNGILELVKENLKAAIEDSRAVITSDHLPAVNAYQGHLVPLFQNLIGNAIKYRGERPLHIHVSVEEKDGQLRFAVTDNGMGIEPEYHRKIFGAFKRLHGNKIPGTGIGLAICQRVVERYGGRIWVESQAGEGASFIFTLPGILRSREET